MRVRNIGPGARPTRDCGCGVRSEALACGLSSRQVHRRVQKAACVSRTTGRTGRPADGPNPCKDGRMATPGGLSAPPRRPRMTRYMGPWAMMTGDLADELADTRSAHNGALNFEPSSSSQEWPGKAQVHQQDPKPCRPNVRGAAPSVRAPPTTTRTNMQAQMSTYTHERTNDRQTHKPSSRSSTAEPATQTTPPTSRSTS